MGWYQRMGHGAMAGVFVLFLSQCGGTTSTATTSSTTSSSASSTSSFPSGLAITSPTATEDASTSGLVRALSARYLSSYEVETDAIEDLLTATSLEECAADVAELFNQVTNANCYGPQVNYEKHPDASGGGPADGQLPGGDLGLWSANNGDTTEACAAAQINARMGGVGDKTMSAMKLLASMICTVNNTEDVDLPADGETVDLATAMGDMLTAAGVTNVTVNTATLAAAANSASTSDYTYSLNTSVSVPSKDDPTVNVESDIQVDMTHRPLDADNDTFEGVFSYYFNSTDSQGNCNRDFGSLNTDDITELGSVAYEKASDTSIVVDARYTQACGQDNTAPLVSGQLDPTEKAVSTHVSGSPSIDGWAGNFSILWADFDPTTNAGDYVFAWQAGVGDGTARTFNLHLADDDSDTLMNGTAFFGYGDEIGTSDGSILGIYCNWAGPGGGVGNDTTKRQDLVQKQTMEENATSGLFEAVASSITYAPTINCNADSAAITAGFKYDTDADGTVDTLTTAVTNDLIDPADATNGITASGFTLPSEPSGL